METLRRADLLPDLTAPPGSLPWAVAVKEQLLLFLEQERGNEEQIESFDKLMRQHEGYKVLPSASGDPFNSHAEFLMAPSPYGLGTTVMVMERVLERARRIRVNEAKRRPLRHHGGSWDKQGQGSTPNLAQGRGDNADYLLRRIHRDRPDVFARYEAGEFRTVAEAARVAGLAYGRRNRKTVVLGDPVKLAAAIRRHFSPEERRQIAAELLREQEATKGP